MTYSRALAVKLGCCAILCACSPQADGADAAAGSRAGGTGGKNGTTATGGRDAFATGGRDAFATGGRDAFATGGRLGSGGTTMTGGMGIGGGNSGGRMDAAGGSRSTSGGSAGSGGTGGKVAQGGATSGGRFVVGGEANATGGAGSAGGTSAARIIGYFAQWGIYQRGYRVKNIVDSSAAAGLTVINYAFGNIVDGQCIMVSRAGVGDAFADYQKSFSADESVDGTADTWDQKLKGNFNQLKKLKARYPKIKVLISIGGWTWSKGFSAAALTAESRTRAVKSCIDLYIHGDLPLLDGDPAGGPGAAAGVFDGIDLDWEYPAYPGDTGSVYRDEDTRNFTLFLAEFRQQLNAIDSKLLLTIAAPAGKPQSDKIELGAIHQHLDWINLMTYDMHGAWDATGPTNFHAPLLDSSDDPTPESSARLSADATVTRYLAAGVPASKLTLGIPFYGRGWTGVGQSNHGLYQPANGPAPGTYESGIEDYHVLAARGTPGFQDAKAGAHWTFDGTQFWSFDDPQSIEVKTEYVRSRGLAGVMVWSLDGDTKDGELMRAVTGGLAK